MGDTHEEEEEGCWLCLCESSGKFRVMVSRIQLGSGLLRFMDIAVCLLCDSLSPSFSFVFANSKKVQCLQCYCLQCFDTVGWAIGRASGL